MQYVKYGNAGIEVSRICLGAMTLLERMEEAQAADLIRQCIDLGCNFIDTADSYAEGASEVLVGKALEGRRDQVIVSTKVWASSYLGRKRPANGSRMHIIDALHASLKRLNTDYIDIYMCHHPDPLTSFEEVYSTLDNLVKQGKIRYVAMCNAYAWQVAYALGVCGKHGWEPPCSVQVSYNLLDRVVENETASMARRFNLVLQTYGPQAGGLLTGKYRRGEPVPEDSRLGKWRRGRDILTDELFDTLDVIREIAQRNDMTMGQLAVCWLLARDGLVVPVVGATRPDHILSVLDCPDRQLPAEDLARLDELTEQHRFQAWRNQPMAAAPAPGLNWL